MIDNYFIKQNLGHDGSDSFPINVIHTVYNETHRFLLKYPRVLSTLG